MINTSKGEPHFSKAQMVWMLHKQNLNVEQFLLIFDCCRERIEAAELKNHNFPKNPRADFSNEFLGKFRTIVVAFDGKKAPDSEHSLTNILLEVLQEDNEPQLVDQKLEKRINRKWAELQGDTKYQCDIDETYIDGITKDWTF